MPYTCVGLHPIGEVVGTGIFHAVAGAVLMEHARALVAALMDVVRVQIVERHRLGL